MSATDATLHASSYDRSACEIGVVHVGYGAFHRAHQAAYLDRYMQESGDLRWGVAAVNLRAPDAPLFARQRAASDGYVLKAVSSAGETDYALIRSHVAFADWSSPAEAEGAEELIARHSVHIVTMTVTEGGYALNAQGALDLDQPAIAAEISGTARSTIYAYLAAGLSRRMRAGGPPVTILCCDNIRSNGDMLRKNLLQYVEATGRTELKAWLENHASFPNSMVDRITPKPSDAHRQDVKAQFGRDDPDVVMAEDFVQWVVEDAFCGPRPELEKVGVEIAKDVHPYEEAKIRILNGGHTGLVYLAALAGVEMFDDAMRRPDLRAHFDALEKNEILPALTIDLPFDKSAYCATIASRFENANIGDTVERISADGTAKFPVFIRPTLIGAFEQGIEPIHTIRAIASWRVFVQRAFAGRIPFEYKDPNIEAIRDLFDDLSAFARSKQLWGDAPERFEQFERLLKQEIDRVEKQWPA